MLLRLGVIHTPKTEGVYEICLPVLVESLLIVPRAPTVPFAFHGCCTNQDTKGYEFGRLQIVFCL